MNRIIFVDAGHCHALINRGDQLHARAMAWQRWLNAEKIAVVTTDMVLWEVLNGNSKPAKRREALDLYRDFDAKDAIEHSNHEWIETALDHYASRADKAWSLTDCMSFLLMADLGITAALTADHHFVQAGFRALLLEEPAPFA